MNRSSAEELAEAAEGNVTEKNLTKTSGLIFTYLYDGPLIEYLESDEQPEYVFSSENKGYRITDSDGAERTPHHTGSEGKRYLLVTDSRVLYVAGRSDGDEYIDHPFESISSVRTVDGDNLEFRTNEGKTYKFAQVGSMSQTVQEAVGYIDEQISASKSGGSTTESEDESSDTAPDNARESDDRSEPVESSNTNKPRLKNIDRDTIRNNSVPDTIVEMDDSVKSDETVFYAYSINAAERGDDHMGGVTTGGCLIATDQRLAAYINETIGSSNLSVTYDRIDSVEIEHGALITKLSIQSTSKTYSFPGFNSIDKTQIHAFADFIREKADEAGEAGGSTDADPTEQLKNLKELYDEGVLSEDEFTAKKETLLEKL